ncbi:MAG: acyl-CoA thioesterase [Desulfovibrionales bacterium]
MQAKKPGESRFIMTRFMVPQDTNPYGSVHGGVIMKGIDEAGAIAAIRHCRRNAVTASIDRLHFHKPVYVGELVFFRANVNMVGRSSMEVGIRVEAENLYSGEVRHVASAYITFVSVDKQGKPTPVPELILETDEDKRRNREAQSRKRMRLEELESERTPT